MTSRINHATIGMLGLVTICAYGSWYYAFGVLIDPIRTDTGWSETSLAASFSAGTVLIGCTSLAGGRLLDQRGHRVVLALGGSLGSLGLLVASFATNITVFFFGAALGLGAFGSLGFYHITMTAAVRLHPGHTKSAIATLTIWGAFASAIFLPLTAWLVEAVEWRVTVRILAISSGIVLGLTAVTLPSPPVRARTASNVSLGHVVRVAVSRPGPLSFTVAVAFGGIAMSTMLVYQVPIMTTAGLSASAAASVAGLRGFAQLGGRLPLSPIVARLGSDRALVLAFSAMALGGALLTISGRLSTAMLFAIVAGFGIGAFSPLQGMKAEELFEPDTLGATMGFYGSVLLLAGSIGPISAGILSEQTGDRRWVGTIIVGSALAAAMAMRQLSEVRRLGPT